MGLAYSVSTNSFSQLIVYFLIQAYSSFSIIIFYLLCRSLFLSVSILIKLCMFPFHSWFISIGYRLNNFILFLRTTLHKLPVFLLLLFFYLDTSSFIVEFSILFSILFSSFTMFLRDFRLLLVCSSVGNNSWFLFSSFCNYTTFVLFFTVYFFSLLIPFILIGSFSKVPDSSKPLAPFSLIFLSGLPPFPIFFSKIFIVYQLCSLNSRVFIVLVLLLNSFMMSAYVSYCLNSILSSFKVNTFFYSLY